MARQDEIRATGGEITCSDCGLSKRDVGAVAMAYGIVDPICCETPIMRGMEIVHG